VNELTGILVDLFLIFLAAKAAAELFERLRQPPVLGELLVGVLIGPHALGLIGVPEVALIEAFHGDVAASQEALDLVFHVIAEIAVVVLLFFVGLETRIADILKVGGRATTVALFGVVLPFVLGYWLMVFLGRPQIEAIFMGAAMVATSVGITARVMRDLGVIASRESRIILGAAVIDDILGMIILAVVAGLAVSGAISPLGVTVIAGQAVLFTAFVVLVGTGALRRYSLQLNRLRMDDAPLAISLLTMLGLAALSAIVGLAAIIGAFLAGMVFAEAREHHELERRALPIYHFLVPFFFVITGAQVDWRLFLDGGLMTLALGVTVLALLGKLVGCGLAMLGTRNRSIAIVGVGMAPRGEVGLIVASFGLSLGAFPPSIFGVVVVMSLLTTIVVPPILSLLYVGDPETAISREDLESQAGLLPDV
jgi:Kef-type K+ transport system membrane component KefB